MQGGPERMDWEGVEEVEDSVGAGNSVMEATPS